LDRVAWHNVKERNKIFSKKRVFQQRGPYLCPTRRRKSVIYLEKGQIFGRSDGDHYMSSPAAHGRRKIRWAGTFDTVSQYCAKGVIERNTQGGACVFFLQNNSCVVIPHGSEKPTS